MVVLCVPDLGISAGGRSFVGDVRVQSANPESQGPGEIDEHGNVTWSRRFIVSLSAEFDFSDLPFDHQSLDVVLESYRMPTTAMTLKWVGTFSALRQSSAGSATASLCPRS